MNRAFSWSCLLGLGLNTVASLGVPVLPRGKGFSFWWWRMVSAVRLSFMAFRDIPSVLTV